MKKSLIALAVLAASGAAMAQSSVTLYGRLDASLAQTTSEVTGFEKNKQTGIDSSNLNTTFWGLKGSEDMGGGLRANFTLESGFAIDTGVGNAGLFERKAIVGLSGAFGAVDLGRNYTAYDTLRGATNNVYDSNFATTGTVWNNGIKDYANRTSNSIIYNSPSFGGFSGAIAYAFGENKNTDVAAVGAKAATRYAPAVPAAAAYTTGDALDTASLHLKYANGPLLVGYGYQEEKIASAAGQDKIQYNLVGASYDLGMAKLVGSYNQAKLGGLKDKEYQVGVSVPFGAAAIAAGYSSSKSEGTVGGLAANNKGTGASLVGTYNLSKRTTVYAGYEAAEVESLNGARTTKTTNFATGVRHTF